MVLDRFRSFLNRFGSFQIVLGRFSSFLTLVFLPIPVVVTLSLTGNCLNVSHLKPARSHSKSLVEARSHSQSFVVTCGLARSHWQSLLVTRSQLQSLLVTRSHLQSLVGWLVCLFITDLMCFVNSRLQVSWVLLGATTPALAPRNCKTISFCLIRKKFGLFLVVC